MERDSFLEALGPVNVEEIISGEVESTLSSLLNGREHTLTSTTRDMFLWLKKSLQPAHMGGGVFVLPDIFDEPIYSMPDQPRETNLIFMPDQGNDFGYLIAPLEFIYKERLTQEQEVFGIAKRVYSFLTGRNGPSDTFSMIEHHHE